MKQEESNFSPTTFNFRGIKMTNKKIQELHDKLGYYFDECKEKDLIIGNFIGWLLNESNLVEAGVINKNAERTYIIYTDEGNLALSHEDILNTIDTDLDMMDNEEERTWTVLRKDMTEEEINNLPVV